VPVGIALSEKAARTSALVWVLPRATLVFWFAASSRSWPTPGVTD
jgi:hypothetical protein